ncbi:hypothetical protein ZYGR_0AK02060 [Zygosaccharomyces rouxii]|uniref:Cyclin-like domain-containing protein n=1 Tax=Zygosaccharomyces rouxii TaxID=4956 RepID=A0A1Q3AD52_ZYGRO|nr:hypothetical protein ZYGR_0AK02060 [Zygosaccharomyces rouxii]
MIRHDSKRSMGSIMAGLPDLAHLSRVRKLRSSAKALDPNLTQKESIVHQRTISEYGSELWLQLQNQLQGSFVNSSNNSWENFKSQPQINCRMRNLIYDFIMCCHTRLNLCTSTLFLSYSILDRYTSRYIVRSGEYQLLALTALWISSKYWDSKNRVATLPVLLSLCCEQYSATQFKNTEIQLLKYLNWSLCDIVTCDSLIDVQLFLQGAPRGIDLNEVKLGTIMLCELSRFDLKLSLDSQLDKIVLAAITLTKLAIKFVKDGQYDNYKVVLSQDSKCLEICDKLLELISKKDSLPSSFRFKYLRMDSRSNKSLRIIESLTGYHMQWQLEQFLTTANFTNSFGENSCYELSLSSSNEFNDSNGNKHNLASSPASCDSASPTSMSNSITSAASPFASPSMGTELSTINTTHTTPESVPTPSFMETRHNQYHHNHTKPILTLQPTLQQSHSQLPPLTPTTPSILQSKLKLGALRRTRSGQNHGHSRNPSFNSRPIMSTSTSAIQPDFLKTHRKRLSSDMDVDFFQDHLATKR